MAKKAREAGCLSAHGARPAPRRGALYRYVFYDWLFRDARSGSALERAAALRHNRSSARWLPTYLRRWSIAAALLVAAEAWAEHSLSSIGLAAVLAVALVLVVVFIVVTTVCWAGLRSPRRSG